MILGQEPAWDDLKSRLNRASPEKLRQALAIVAQPGIGDPLMRLASALGADPELALYLEPGWPEASAPA